MREFFLVLAVLLGLGACNMADGSELEIAARAARANDDASDDLKEAGGKPSQAWGTTTTLTTTGAPAANALSIAFPEAGVYTLQFGIINPPKNGAPLGEALITWTVRGQPLTRRITLANGASIQGNAEGLSVTLTPGSQLGLPDVDYKVVAVVTKGTRAATATPPRYTFPGMLFVGAGATSLDFVVPEDSGATGVYVEVGSPGNPIPENGITVQQMNGATIVAEHDPRIFQWIPLDGQTRSIKVRNTSASGIQIRVWLAIDG